jgi:predicted ATPase/DNA-binding XRE family transcriptional regulator
MRGYRSAIQTAIQFRGRNALVEVSFGEWLKRRRKSLGLTQEQLALQVSCSAIMLRKIEAEERRPSEGIVNRLAEIFHIPPTEQKAFQRFARGDSGFAPAEIIEDTPWHVSTASPRSLLPSITTSLIGREQEIALVRKYLINPEIRLVTLVGPPGIGKTRLSIESARVSLHDFPDGVFFIGLAPVDDPSRIALAIAQSLGFIGATNISTDEQLKEGIGDKQILLVIDNCEHLIEDVASLASFLLSACSRLKILATSRESLRIAGEWLYPVPAFDVPAETSVLDMESASNFPALMLFAERARAVRPDFVLNAENIKTISAICSHLDGLPLAIELIAARMRLMSPESLLALLSDQFILSADGMRAASARQKTLNNAISWSYNLLSNEEQKLFSYLSVFSGGFTAEVAEFIFSRSFTGKSIENLIISLLDKSLIQRVTGGEPLYTMLVTIQEFARGRLRDLGKEAEIRNWHLAYFLELAEEADKELRGPNQLEWLRRLESVRDNLRASLDWAIETRQTETALQLARKLHWFWFVRGDHIEGRQWLGRVLKMPDTPLHPQAFAEVLAQLAHHAYIQREHKKAQLFAEQALSIAYTHADKHNHARALVMLGLVLDDDNYTASRSALEEAKALFQEVNDEWSYTHAVMCLAWGAYYQYDYVAVLTLSEQALALFRTLGDRYFESVTLRLIGLLQLKQGNWTNGVAALRESLLLAHQLESKNEIAAALQRIGEAEQSAGNLVRAVRLRWAAKNIYDSMGVWEQKDELNFENDLASCRVELGESSFAQATEKGRAMTMEQAIQLAVG